MAALLPHQQDYIRANYKRLYPKEIARLQNIPDVETVRKFMRENNLPSLHSTREVAEKSHDLTEEDKEFIIANCGQMTIPLLAKGINNTYHAVNRFVKKRRLQVMRGKRGRKAEAPEIKQPIKRVPGQYSNHGYLSLTNQLSTDV